MLVLKKGEGDRASSRSAAIMLDLATYDTGKLCGRAHLSPRYTSTGACVECVKQRTLLDQGIHKKQKEQEDYTQGHLVPKELAKEWRVAFYNTMEILPCGHMAQQLVINDKCRLCLQNERNNQKHEERTRSTKASRRADDLKREANSKLARDLLS